MSDSGPWVDGHLDLAYSLTTIGRDLTLDLDTLRAREQRSSRTAMVTFPELRRGNVGVVFGTLFALPHMPTPEGYPPAIIRGYTTAEEAHQQARAQMDAYRRMEDAGFVRIICSVRDLEQHLSEYASTPEASRRTGVVVLMEGADPIRTPDELAFWHAQGVRLLGPAWQKNRYCGGTGGPGGLTPMGEALLDHARALGMTLDVSHMAEESFWQALARFEGPVMASHSNARAIVDTDRQLSDAMLDALAQRDAVVGLVLYDKFLTQPVPQTGVSLAHVRRQAEHIAGRIGWSRLAIGSDFDGGLGREETPVEIDRAGDFARLGEVVPAAFRDGVLGGHWLHFLRRVLPPA